MALKLREDVVVKEINLSVTTTNHSVYGEFSGSGGRSKLMLKYAVRDHFK